MSFSINTSKKGITSAFCNVIPYALVPLILLINFAGDNTSGFAFAFASGSVLTFCKDGFCALGFFAMAFYRDRKCTFFKLYKSKAGFLAIISGILGGPIGYTLYNTSFYLVGPSFGHMFSALTPVFISLSSILMLKRKHKWQIWMGIAITSVAIASLSISETFTAKEHWKIIVGSILGILGSLAWSLETLFLDKAFNYPHDDNIMALLNAKTLFSSFFSLMVIMPVTAAIYGDATWGYKQLGHIFTNGIWLLRVVLAGLLIVLGRFLYFLAVKESGSTLVGVAYNLTIIFTPLFSLIYYGISGQQITPSEPNLNLLFQICLWSAAPFICLGAMIVVFYSPYLEREQLVDKVPQES